jgi:hypothetical protein
MYFRPETNERFTTHSDIRSRIRAMFPEVITDENLAFVGVFPLIPTASGATDQQTAIEDAPTLVDGEWRQTWAVRDATPEDLAARAPVVPQSVPMLNAHLVLIESGAMAAVRAYLDGLAGMEGEQARVYFDKALTMKRNHPLVLSIPESLMTEAQKDALFIAAGALDA